MDKTGAWTADSTWTPVRTTACSIRWVSISFRKWTFKPRTMTLSLGAPASATVNVVTKSGGEQYHGGGFEFVQNNIFNAETQGRN